MVANLTIKEQVRVSLSSLPAVLSCFRATPVRAEAAAAAAAEEEAEEEEEGAQGMKTTRFPPSRLQTTSTLLYFTSQSTSRATPSTLCLTTACSTPTPILSCLPSWCPTCWVRTLTSSLGLCTRWVGSPPFIPPIPHFSCGPLRESRTVLQFRIRLHDQGIGSQPASLKHWHAPLIESLVCLQVLKSFKQKIIKNPLRFLQYL